MDGSAASGAELPGAGTSGCVPALQAPELPDEVLLAVFAWLDWRDLLRVRAVCLLWRRMATDPALWSTHSFSLPEDDIAAVLVALCYAPCLRSLTFSRLVDVEGLPLTRAVSSHASNTNCAIHKLVFCFCSDLSIDVVHDIKIILRCQRELKQLKAVTLDDTPPTFAFELIAAALGACVSELEVNMYYEWTYPGPGLATPPNGLPENASSLEVFVYYSCHADPLMEALMAPHTATLKSVKLTGKASSRAVKLMCQCPRLRVVEIPCVPAAAGLAACPLLTDLSLTIRHPVPEVFPFFRNASGITRLSLSLAYDIDGTPDHRLRTAFLLGLISELGSTKLKELRLGRFFFLEYPVKFDMPIDALSRFPLLSSLRLRNLPSVKLLDAITPSLAPNLRLLRFMDVWWNQVECVLSNCCYPALFRLVRRNPLLHVAGIPSSHACVDGACKCCPMGRHTIANGPIGGSTITHCSLYGHGEKQACQVSSHFYGRPGKCVEYACSCAHEWRLVLPTAALSKLVQDLL